MNWQSTIGLIVALAAVSFVAPSIALIGHTHKSLPAFSSSLTREMNNLTAEEINRRTLQLAATIK